MTGGLEEFWVQCDRGTGSENTITHSLLKLLIQTDHIPCPLVKGSLFSFLVTGGLGAEALFIFQTPKSCDRGTSNF